MLSFDFERCAHSVAADQVDDRVGFFRSSAGSATSSVLLFHSKRVILAVRRHGILGGADDR